MGKITCFILLFTSTIYYSNNLNLNIDSWKISVGKKTILSSYNKNEMGDLVVLNKINLNDTLYAERILCGQHISKNLVSIITVKKNNKVICEKLNIKSGSVFESKIQLAEIFNKENIDSGDIIDIYFTIEKVKNVSMETVLLGRIKIK